MQVERSKSAFLSQRQAAGDRTNPFADARRVAAAAAASRPLVIPPATGNIGGAAHGMMGNGHGPGHQLHAGTAHGPGGSPMPGEQCAGALCISHEQVGHFVVCSTPRLEMLQLPQKGTCMRGQRRITYNNQGF